MTSLRPYDRVSILTDKFRSEGVEAGAIGYIIESHKDGVFEVEVSDPTTGETIALLVATDQELVAAVKPPGATD